MLLCAVAFSAAMLSAGTTPLLRAGTFSIVARDSANGDLGVAVQSKFPNVRVAVPFGVNDISFESEEFKYQVFCVCNGCQIRLRYTPSPGDRLLAQHSFQGLAVRKHVDRYHSNGLV